ncbi:hypothetical protein GS682_03695 [Nostoc sp. B(2019)]|nr:hypothetical protein [Nostoc sp. B(2019)]
MSKTLRRRIAVSQCGGRVPQHKEAGVSVAYPQHSPVGLVVRHRSALNQKHNLY